MVPFTEMGRVWKESDLETREPIRDFLFCFVLATLYVFESPIKYPTRNTDQPFVYET